MQNFKAYTSQTLGGYYGMLTLLSYNNKFFICVEDHSGFDWVEIKEAYYKQTLKCKPLQMKEITNESNFYKQIQNSLKEENNE